MSAPCLGFFFRYFIPDEDGLPCETKADDHFYETEERVLLRVQDVLQGRPDLMKKVSCLEDGLEIRLYQGTQFQDFEDEEHFYGRVTFEGKHVIWELATDEVLHGGQKNHDVLDVVVHELIHVLDFLDDEDGILPGWTKAQKKKYHKARNTVEKKIRAGKSILDPYALTNDKEFLAVLGETFFVKPGQLKKDSQVLFDLMKDFFKFEPEAT